MKKNVLVPTDFTIESLNVVKSLLNQQHDGCVYNIVLVHGVRVSDSIADLLFFSKAKLIDSLSSRSFEDACRVIKNKYESSVHAIWSDVFTGNTQTAFATYLRANKIDEIYVPSAYRLVLKDKRSVDMLPFIKNCERSVMQIEWNREVVMPEKGQLAEVFYNEVSVG